MSLLDIFYTVVRDKLYENLKQGLLRMWSPAVVYKFINEVIQEKRENINYYLQTHTVTLQNIDDGANAVIRDILMPYILEKRVI